jgi:putative nucleotidyltransferase with HDIG domain
MIKKTDDKKQSKTKLTNLLMLILACLITICFLLANSTVFSTDPIQVGSVSPKRYVADRTVENTLATEKLREEAADTVGVLYEHDEKVYEDAMNKIESYFNEVNKELEIINNTMDITSGDLSNYKPSISFSLPVVVSAEQYRAYNDLTDDGKVVFKDDIKNAATAAFDQGITEDTLDKSYEISDSYVDGLAWGSNLKNMAKAVARAAIEPNLVIDEEAIEAARQKKMDEVEPVMILKDQKIVDEGDIITQEDYEILSALGYTDTKVTGNIILFAANAAIILLTFCAFYLYITSIQKKMFNEGNVFVILFAIYIIEAVGLAVTANMESFALVPVSLFAMYATVLIKPKTAIALNIFVSIIGTVIFRGSVDFLIYSLLSGTFAVVLVQHTQKRALIFPVSVAVGFADVVSYIASQVFLTKSMTLGIFYQGLLSGVVGVVLVIVTVGSLPIWENMFGVNTKYRLAELTNPNNELMRRLMIETPGTYHHSLIVANLAETAAYEIYANEALARAGAYYHDIGKLVNPAYFSENQIDKNAHDCLDPYISAKMIIDHVENGLKLAEKHKLPKVIKDIIAQHHGTTLVKYFYMKSSKEKPGEMTKEEDFRYPGPIPQSKEAAIVMLADTIEAAVRSMMSSGKSIDDIKNIIDVLVQDKLEDGQLNDCRLDLKEIEIIKKAFLKMFKGMYHERIAYPKTEEIKAVREAEKAREAEHKNDSAN